MKIEVDRDKLEWIKYITLVFRSTLGRGNDPVGAREYSSEVLSFVNELLKRLKEEEGLEKKEEE